MKTKARLTLLLGVLLVLFTTLAIVSLATIWRLRSEGTNVIQANYNSIAYMQGMLDALDTEPDSTRRAGRLMEQLDLQRRNITEPTEAETTERLARSTEASVRAPHDPAATLALRRSIAAVLDLNRAAIVAKAEAQELRGERAVVWISIAAALGFLIAFSLFLSVPERIAEPIRKLTEGIDRIAAGHYDERVELNRRDEFGHMADRFNAMAGELERWRNSKLAHIMAEKARAEAVINSLRDPSIGVDDAQRILFMNRQAAELLGVVPGELLGLTTAEAVRRNDLLARILGSGGATTFKAVLQGREQQFTVESSDIDTGQVHLGTVYTLHNITPFLERDQAKTMFLATISHELKTPLASSDIGLGILERDTSLSAAQLAILTDLRKDHQRLVRIVSELLDLAQLESGRMRITVAPHPLQPSVLEACTAVHALAEARRITLRNELPIDLPPVLHDPDRTIWVLVNLLNNALRHAPVGSTVTIGSDLQGEQLCLLVSDEGSGIARSVHDHLFEPFGEGATGTGLGLSIARRFMEAMQGGITVEPLEPQGTRIRLSFRKG